MAELIEREALISFIGCGHLRSPSEKCYSELDIVNLLKTQKVVDAVPVVRCGECKCHEIVNYTYVCCFHNCITLFNAGRDGHISVPMNSIVNQLRLYGSTNNHGRAGNECRVPKEILNNVAELVVQLSSYILDGCDEDCLGDASVGICRCEWWNCDANHEGCLLKTWISSDADAKIGDV